MKLRHQHRKGEIRLENRKDLRTQRKKTECEDQAQLQPANERGREWALVRREAEQVGDDRLVHMTLHGAFCALSHEIAFSSNYLILTTMYTRKQPN